MRVPTSASVAASVSASVLALVLAGCSGGVADGPADREPTSTGAAVETPEPEPRPPLGACYRLAVADAAAPSPEAEPVDCEERHTSLTFHVASLPGEAVEDGDAEALRDRISRTCESRLARFLGTNPRTHRLSVLRALWFAPRLEDADRPEDWYRCDVVALAGSDELAPLAGPMKGALSAPAGLGRYGVCGTARPGTPRFEQVICSRPHAWRATTSYDADAGPYPGPEALRRAGAETCRAEAERLAEDGLDYEWAMDWPTREQWREGRRWGLCWAPS